MRIANPIYFLGQGLKCVDVPVLKINRHYPDLTTGDEVRITDPFVEALTHDSIVVQINRLKNRRRTELERLLEVFDQGRASRSDPHLLDILEENFPVHHREVLRRLMRAGAEQEVRDKMDVEDDILIAIQDQARESADLRQALVEKDQALEDKGKSLEEKDKALEEKDKSLEEKDKSLEEKDKALEEKDKALEGKNRLIADLEKRLSRA